MRFGLLTSVDTRHRFFANALHARFDVAAVGYERTGYDPSATDRHDLTDHEVTMVRHHFKERARQEQRYFGHDCGAIQGDRHTAVREIEPGGLNTPSVMEFLRACRVDTLVVYGTNLIRLPILDSWSGRIINLHLGLSPYYRGTATNFYPLLNEEPEYVGATIHLIDAGIDSGPILAHARPQIVSGDAPHTIGCKAILAGIEAMIAVLHASESGHVATTPQWKPDRARLYLRRDYHPRQVVELYRKLEDGLIDRYLARAAAGCIANPRLITPPEAQRSARRSNASPCSCESI